MKPGDKVWVFIDYPVEEIRTAEVVSATDGCEFVKILIDGNRPSYPTAWWRCCLFSTREALCEHYRKIFE
jgi:hypothetical protein